MAIYNVRPIITKPKILANQSIALPASFIKKMMIAMLQLMIAPTSALHPVNTFKPNPAPATLAILKANEPMTISVVKKMPAPGKTLSAKSGAYNFDTPMMRQIFNWAPISSNKEIKITNPKLANNWLVNFVVCVINPGPIAEVAIRKAAPKNAPE